MSTHATTLALAAALFAADARAQSFNIDIAGGYATPPDSSYGAGANQPGYWNGTGFDPLRLTTTDGLMSNATYYGGGGPLLFSIDGAEEHDARLMGSVEWIFSSPWIFIHDLEPGLYDVCTYLWAGSLQGTHSVQYSLWNGTFPHTEGSVRFDEGWPGGQQEGVTFDRLQIEVLPEHRFLGFLFGVAGKTPVFVNGIQLTRVPAPGMAVPVAALACGYLSRRRRT